MVIMDLMIITVLMLMTILMVMTVVRYDASISSKAARQGLAVLDSGRPAISSQRTYIYARQLAAAVSASTP